MNPTFHPALVQAAAAERVREMHAQARADRLARQARKARRAQRAANTTCR